MQVLHAHWRPPAALAEAGMLILWAENSQMQSAAVKRGKRLAAGPHPFCTDPYSLAGLLAGLGAHVGPVRSASARLWLPTTGSRPQPSPQLQHEWELDNGAAVGLAPWFVVGLGLTPPAAFQLLTGLFRFSSQPPNLALGADFRYWQTASVLALETLAQQKMAPGLVRADGQDRQFQARWMPVLDGPYDGARLARLRAAMPPLCRSEAEDPALAPAPRTVLDSFLQAMVDTLARQWGKAHLPSGLTRREPGRDDPAFRWLLALFEPDPAVPGFPAQLKHLAQNHQLWLRNLHAAGDTNFRVAFRLEAPLQQEQPARGQQWQLHFLLQARDDPSLLIPAQQVWKTKGRVLRALNRRFEQPQEKLLTGLGYAARLFEPLRAGLKTAAPTALTLTGDEAYTFLREGAPLLEASGFGVLVPPWWNKPGTRLGVRLKMTSRHSQNPDAIPKSKVSLENLVRYRWELSLGDVTLTREEFEALVALKSPLVEIRGQWVQLDPEQIEAAIRFWEKQRLEAEVSLAEAVRLGLGTTETAEGLPVEQVEYEGWLKVWMDRFAGNEKLAVLQPPEGLQATLRPYQQYGYSWLAFLRRWGLGACLADDMGLGKTVQTLALILREKEESGGRLAGPVLVVCPTSVVSNWAREAQHFTPGLTCLVHQGPGRLRDEAFVKQARAVDLTLTSYAVVRRDAAVMQSVDWLGIVLDEAQNIKNSETLQAQAIRSLPAGFRLALTGTPVENRLSELWSIMQFLNPGYLGSRHNFRRKFALPIERYQDDEALQQLKSMASPFILRRVKTDPRVIQDLPEKQEMKVYCHLTEEQATLYEAVVQRALIEVGQAEGIERRGKVLGMLMQLKQICNHPAQFLHQVDESYRPEPGPETARSGKLARLTEMLEEALAVEDRALIFTQFAEMGFLLKNHLQERLGVPALFLHGGTPAKKRSIMVERFQKGTGGPPIFILSLKAGGTGLNLTQANHVFHFDRWWNPAVENQATDRAFRIGQKRNVQVHKFVCVGTMEEMIDDMIESKKALAESVVGSGENWLTELSTDELRDLVRLRREAVA